MLSSLAEIIKNPTVIAAVVAAVAGVSTSFMTTVLQTSRIREGAIYEFRLKYFSETRKMYQDEYDIFITEHTRDEIRRNRGDFAEDENNQFFLRISEFYLVSRRFYERNKKLYNSAEINQTISEVNRAVEIVSKSQEDGMLDLQDPRVEKTYLDSFNLRIKAIQEIYRWSNDH